MALTGSTPIDALVEEAKRLSPAEFDAAFNCPVLMILPTSDTVVTERLEITNPSQFAVANKPAQPPEFVTLVFPVRPGAKNTDPKRLSIGRDETSDVTIPLGTISKAHAWLTQSGEGWSVEDAGSTNGTWVDGRRVRDRSTTPLKDGCELRLGENLATFWLAESFRAALRKRAGIK